MKEKPCATTLAVYICQKTFLPAFFIAITCTATPQSTYDSKITSTQIKAGRTPNSMGIPATEISFPTFVYAIHFDSTRNELLAVIRERSSKYYKNKGALIVINPQNGLVKWSKEITDNHFDFQIAKDHLISIRQTETVVYERNNGARRWMKPFKMAFVDDKNGIGLTEDGIAFDLYTGEKKWKTYINNEYGWQQLALPNDSTVVIGAAGLTSINMQTGKTWYYRMKNDVAELNTALGICSNILIDSNLIYFATLESLACLDMNGKVMWKSELPKKHTGNMLIWKKDNTIQLLNNGYVYLKFNFAFPYIAAFDKATGKQHYLNLLGTRKAIASYGFSEDTLFIHAHNRVYKYNMASGEKLLEVDAENSKLDKHLVFASATQNFIQTANDQYKRLVDMYPMEKFLVNEQNIIRIDAWLNPIGTTTEPLWQLYDKYHDLDVLTDKNEVVFVGDGKMIAAFKIEKATIQGNWLIDVGESKLRIVDLKNLPD